jgi:hypothetical protein
MSTTRFYEGEDAGESSTAFQRRCQEIHLNDQTEGAKLPEGWTYTFISREEAEEEYQAWLAQRNAPQPAQ